MPEPTPAQIEENNRIKNLPIIEELKDNQEGMKQSIDDLSHIIASEQKQNKEEFARGAEKFSKLETKIAELEDTMNNGLKDVVGSIIGLKTELKDDRIGKLSKQLDDKNTIRNGLLVTIFTVILTTIFSNIPPLTTG